MTLLYTADLQVFIAIDAVRLGSDFATVQRVVADMHSGTAAEGRAPGEGMHRARARSLDEGVAVDSALWRTILSL
jgi:LDH2 family malate/lactate/ureidoglycolate dehydrogenase